MDREERSSLDPDDGVSVADAGSVAVSMLVLANVVMAVMLLVAASGGAVGTATPQVPTEQQQQ